MYDTIWREAPDGKKCSCMIVHKGILEVYNYIFYTHAGFACVHKGILEVYNYVFYTHAGSHVVSYDTMYLKGRSGVFCGHMKMALNTNNP